MSVNRQHLEALSKAPDVLRSMACIVDGERIWTDCRVSTVSDLPTSVPEQYKPLGKLWADNQISTTREVALPGELYPHPGLGFVRAIRSGTQKTLIQEAYWRTFCDGAEVFLDPQGADRIIFFADGELIAVVAGAYGNSPNDPIPENPTDADVFAHIACEANGYYLQPKTNELERLRNELTELKSELFSLESRMFEIQADISETSSEIEDLQETIRDLEKAAA